MSTVEGFRQLEKELDDLVFRQEFSAAAECAARIRELVESAAREQPDQIPTFAAQGIRAIESARRKICTSRARIADCRLRLEHAAEYRHPTEPAAHTCVLDA